MINPASPETIAKLDNLFVDSAYVIPRNSLSAALVAPEVLEMLGSGELTVRQFAAYPESLTGEHLESVVGDIEDAHEGASVPPLPDLRNPEGGVYRGAGLFVGNVLQTLGQLARGDEGEEFAVIGKPGYDEHDLATLQEKVDDEGFVFIAVTLYTALREALGTTEGRRATATYRDSMRATANEYAALLADLDSENPRRAELEEQKNREYGGHAGKLREVTIGLAQLPVVTAAGSLGLSERVAKTFLANATNGRPHEAWINPTAQ